MRGWGCRLINGRWKPLRKREEGNVYFRGWPMYFCRGIQKVNLYSKIKSNQEAYLEEQWKAFVANVILVENYSMKGKGKLEDKKKKIRRKSLCRMSPQCPPITLLTVDSVNTWTFKCLEPWPKVLGIEA
ncbi:hypothetical protein CEXT_524061 [Caerostris extrusa]|uniref:Uncharacterized protein n=1 Tax=Caerostris extrusa TaxID=172846 RepID=A0AAV4RZC3_CAEEX|nr:hypothetical protein CEXT_524061 [Caerostris extrusa]